MIIVQLTGGLGNQMFQYAIGRRMAVFHNTSLKLDISYYEIQGNHVTPRKYELGCFAIVEGFATKEEIRNTKGSQPKWLQKATRYITPQVCHVYKERNKNFDKHVLSTPSDVYLKGYYQSEDYFKDSEPVLRKDFSFKKPLNAKAGFLIEKIKTTHSVSLHFRRTDYLGKEVEKICTPDYYRKALNIIADQVPGIQIFLFSDDIEWVKRNVSFDFPAIYVDENFTSKEGWMDMQLMSLCKHNIIANSSFSWWAAWLNANSEKIVVTPSEWNFKRDIHSIIPKRWMILKS